MEFYRYDTPTIMSGRVVRYKDMNSDFCISASRDGVMLHNQSPLLKSFGDIESVNAVLIRAHRQHVELERGSGLHQKPETLDFESDPACVVEYRHYHFGTLGKYDVLATRETAEEGEDLAPRTWDGTLFLFWKKLTREQRRKLIADDMNVLPSAELLVDDANARWYGMALKVIKEKQLENDFRKRIDEILSMR